ncbi:hypothetical protein [Clostridium formicaceticum]|uniref:Uncharacterized protein n=1 Tax=Clostridium formicaceticum TaxID=1497 RepID=A0AAC9RHL2_9CLOT|nr:hypothetical protein [Clostridium formicaceticum]AOY76705.1 hypothetical protein BJL90_13005 [Clostridium formicaceticum]ARE87139.1 hypothetical protein CLFO_15250 [Clostridium formicaceticum]
MVDFSLKYSIENKAPITIIYQKGMEIIQRKVIVKEIQGDMVKSYCCSKKATRNFKKDNILAAMILGVQENYTIGSRTVGV